MQHAHFKHGAIRENYIAIVSFSIEKSIVNSIRDSVKLVRLTIGKI